MLLPEPDLRRHNAALVVDSHEDAENPIEKDPDRHKNACSLAGSRKTDGAEDEGDSREEKAGFLVRFQGEEERS